MKELRFFTLGALAVLCGTVFGQSFAEFLNVRIFQTLEVQGSVIDSTGNLTLDDDVDVTGALTVTGGCTGCGAGGAPGGMDNDLQFNDMGSFGGDSNLTWDGSSLGVTGNQVLTGTLDAQGAISDSLGNLTLADLVDVTGQVLTLNNAGPIFRWLENDASADNGLWTAFANMEQWSFGPATDAGVQGPALVVDRTGNTVDLVAFPGTAVEVEDLTVNGTCTGCGGGGSAGSSGDVQYSDGAGGFSAEAEFNYVSGTNTLTFENGSVTGGVTITGNNNLTFSNMNPGYILDAVGSAMDNAIWIERVESERWRLEAVDDSFSTFTEFLGVERTGTTVDLVQTTATEIDLTGTTLDFNGVADFSSSVTAASLISNGGVSSVNAMVGPLGAVGTPSFTFTGDTDTGVYRPSSDVVGIAGNGTQVASFSTSAVALTATAITANSVNITPTTGTFSANWTTACTTTPSTNFRYFKIGNMVTLQMETSVSCTSDTTIFAIDAGSLPAAIRPTTNQCVAAMRGTNNTSTAVDVAGRVQSDGGMNFTLNPVGGTTTCSSTNWTASGTKAIGQFAISYILN